MVMCNPSGWLDCGNIIELLFHQMTSLELKSSILSSMAEYNFIDRLRLADYITVLRICQLIPLIVVTSDRVAMSKYFKYVNKPNGYDLHIHGFDGTYRLTYLCSGGITNILLYHPHLEFTEPDEVTNLYCDKSGQIMMGLTVIGDEHYHNGKRCLKGLRCGR